MKQPEPTAPGLDNRTVIIGSTGSGKSVAGAHKLLRYREMWPDFPWVIFNPKCDKLLDSIGAERADLSARLGKRALGPSMRIYSPVPESDDDDEHVNAIIDQAMWHGNVGLFFDEGYSVPKNSKSYRRAQTQGRSKQVPIITLTQRPVWLDRFTFSEASFYQVFALATENDRKRVREDVGINLKETELPKYCSHWVEVSTGRRSIFSPGPTEGEILQRFHDLKPKRKGLLGWL
jgi:hypothetical protein